MTYEHYTVDDFLLDDQFLAYCRGSDPAAVAFWEGWQQQKPPNLTAFREAERISQLLSARKPRMDEALRELETLIAAGPSPGMPDHRRTGSAQSPPTKVVPMPVRSVSWWAVAASVVLVSALGVGGYWFWQNQYVVYETAYNEQRIVNLPDGSTVTLNSHSVLKHRRNGFSDQGRAVELVGEGFFSVRHTSTDATFRVTTGGPFAVEVLGTEFTLQNRPAVQRVVLNTGKVQVRIADSRPPVTLLPGQLVELRPGREPIGPRNVRTDQHNAWMRQQFVFDNTSLTDVIQTVENQFGVMVQVQGKAIRERRFTGVLPINQPETVLNALAQLNGLTLRKMGDVYRLSD